MHNSRSCPLSLSDQNRKRNVPFGLRGNGTGGRPVIRLANLLRYRDAGIDLFLGPGHDGRASRQRRSDSQLRKRRAHLSLCPFSHPIPPPSRILFSSTALARIRSWQCTCKSEQVPTGPSSLGSPLLPPSPPRHPPPHPSFSPRVYHPRYLSLRTPVSMLSQIFFRDPTKNMATRLSGKFERAVRSKAAAYLAGTPFGVPTAIVKDFGFIGRYYLIA